MNLDPRSVRGAIREFLASHLPFGERVLDIGSKLPGAHAVWADNRTLAPEAQWLGVDTSPGPNVDRVLDAAHLPGEFWERFDTVICSEVLEHVQDPLAVIRSMRFALAPGGKAIVTTLTAFPIHNYPADYWRFTPQGLALLFQQAGFRRWSTSEAGQRTVMLSNIGEPAQPYPVHLHVFGVAYK